MAAGLSSDQVKSRVATGRWRVLRRGVYCLRSTWESATLEGRHVLEVDAALARADGALWVSHASAAVLYGLPLPRAGSPVYLTRPPPRGTSYLRGVHVEAATLPVADRTRRAGRPLTSLARTVADCARHLPPADGLAVADAALRSHPEVRHGALSVLSACDTWPNAARARRVLRLVDGGRESPLESWSCWYLHRLGLPAPSWQVNLFDAAGRWLARVDAWWEEFAVAGEADGRVKYDVGPVEDLAAARQALYDEKRREDRLRAAGVGVVRWGALDLRRPEEWGRRVREQLAAHDRAAFRGRSVPAYPDLLARQAGS